MFRGADVRCRASMLPLTTSTRSGHTPTILHSIQMASCQPCISDQHEPSLTTLSDPSKNEEAFAVFLDGTAHFTSNSSAYVNLTFAGTGLDIYGASGPAYGSYSVELDGQTTTATAYAPVNGTLPHLLYTTSDLNTSQQHFLVLRNLGNNGNSTQGSQMLLDFARLTVPVAARG